jgi:glycerol kinase
MSEPRYVLALDQGTTSCRALLFDRAGRVAGVAQEEFTQHYPRPGWVEHDADEIWRVQRRVMEAVAAPVGAQSIAAIGIANQRETTVVWDRETGYPLHPAIVWQCRRSTETCERLRADGVEPMVREKTGLLLDPYFSATKLTWLFENHPALREKATAGEALFGTVDSWLLWNLSPAGARVHATDVSNASRTLLFNLHTRDWDEDLLTLFDVPRAMLPTILPSSDVYFHTNLLGAPILVAGAAGDSRRRSSGRRALRRGWRRTRMGPVASCS